MRHQVALEFDACISRLFPTMEPGARQRIHKFLLTHERKNSCLDRLCEQILKAEQSANIGGKFDRRRFDSFIDTTVRMFADAAMQLEAEGHYTRAKKQQMIDLAGYIADCQAEQDELQKELASGKLISRPGGVAG